MANAALLANAAWAAASVPAYLQLRAALDDPEAAQRAILRRYLRRNSQTLFGKAHRFDTIYSVADFRSRVPIRSYDEFADDIARIRIGEGNVLTADRVIRLMPSSGSTAAAKLIPYTAELQREFNAAVGPWMVDLFRSDPSLIAGPAYWSVSPAMRRDAERAAVPVGYDDDADYLGGSRARLVNVLMAAPSQLRHVRDIAAFRYATMRFLLARADLRIVSVWHPSFLEMLLDAAARHWEALVDDVARGTLTPPCEIDAALHARLTARLRPDARRAAELRGAGNWKAVWPRLGLVSAWADANAAGPARILSARLAGVPFQAKGLLSTEAFVTVPFAGEWPVAVRSHFFEFVDEAGRQRTTDELRDGESYGVVVTTAGGLWRCRLGDRVSACGRVGRTPSLRFVGRDDAVADRFGEKLSEGFVAGVIAALFDHAPAFAMLSFEANRYVLFVETDRACPETLPGKLDDALRANPHYAYCRDLGQLAAADVARTKPRAYDAYCEFLVERRHARVGDIKPAALDPSGGWAATFASASNETPRSGVCHVGASDAG